jgi:hypothetical protein
MTPGGRVYATFKYQGERPDGARFVSFTRLPVLFFDDARTGWVVDEDGELVPAERIQGFDGLEERERPIAMTPAPPGWNMVFEGGFRAPVVSWVLFDDGTVRGVAVTGDGPGIEGDVFWTPWSSSSASYEPAGGWPDVAAT